MTKHHSGRSSVILDAGYVSITTDGRRASTKFIGLHGTKLICVVFAIICLFFISLINLTCLFWIMFKLDWTPLYKNGSKIFRYDQFKQQLEFYNQVTFNATILTTSIDDQATIDFHSNNQIEIYGDHHSIVLDNNQITMNTKELLLNNQSLVDFTDLYALKFNQNRRTRIHLNDLNSQQIHNSDLNLTASQFLKISDINHLYVSSQHLFIEAHRNHRQSSLRFGNPSKRDRSFHHREKPSIGNIVFRADPTFFNLPRLPFVRNVSHSESSIYRLCICNTSFLLLKSFAHQSCPLC